MNVENGPLNLRQIHDAVIFKALRGGFLGPLRFFLKNIELEWEECRTACAFRRGGVAIVRLSPDFVTNNSLTVSETADVIMHEIMHHLLRHLFVATGLLKQGFSHALQNLAMDAVINALLHSVGCALFMERFYPDERELAFLRPNSRNFAIPSGVIFKHIKPVREVNADKSQKFYDFYRRLYALEAGLDEALKFFKEHFPEALSNDDLLGEHGEGDSDEGDDEKAPDDKHGSLFNQSEAQAILEALKIVPVSVSQQASNNFAEIIRRIASMLNQQGDSRANRRHSKRFPAKLNREDIFNIERDRMMFQRPDYRLREVVICPDISSSMDKYIPFVIGLIQKLQLANVSVRILCWAGKTVEVPLNEVLRGNLPAKVDRSSTNGETLAQFLEREHIAHAVVITDNYAGTIRTRMNTHIHLCLVKDGKQSGSFMDREVVPRCKLYQLSLS